MGGGGGYLFMKYDVFRQNVEFFKRIELISFKLKQRQQLFDRIMSKFKKYFDNHLKN